MGLHKNDSNGNIKYFLHVKVTQNMWSGLVFIYVIGFSASRYRPFNLSYICPPLWGLRIHLWSMGTHRADSVNSDDRVAMMIVSRGHLQLTVGCEQLCWHSSHSWSFAFMVATFCYLGAEKCAYKSDQGSNTDPSEWESSIMPKTTRTSILSYNFLWNLISP
jgi:hypothetical protein